MSVSAINETDPTTCAGCGSPITGHRVDWQNYSTSKQFNMADINSLVCQHCGAEFCAICHRQKIKLNLFTGYSTVICPVCGAKFGPGSARLKLKLDETRPEQETIPVESPSLRVNLLNIPQTNRRAILKGFWGLLLVAGGIFLMMQGNMEGDDWVVNIVKYLPFLLILGGGGIVVNALKPLIDLKKNKIMECPHCGKLFPINNRWISFICQNCGRSLFLNILNIQFNHNELDSMATCGYCHAPNQIAERKTWTTCPQCKQRVDLEHLSRYV